MNITELMPKHPIVDDLSLTSPREFNEKIATCRAAGFYHAVQALEANQRHWNREG